MYKEESCHDFGCASAYGVGQLHNMGRNRTRSLLKRQCVLHIHQPIQDNKIRKDMRHSKEDGRITS